MIDAYQLHKSFAAITAVESVSFTARRGEIYGLLGPNGAGKTTTLRMIYGLLKPSAGRVEIDGLNVHDNLLAAQKRLGVLPDGGSLYRRLTARENIRYFGELHDMPSTAIKDAIAFFCDILKMGDIIDRQTKGFSQGQRMKVCLARALVHSPDYVLLDEPTNGLDVPTTRAVRNLLHELKNQGKCIIFSSHLMHEVANLCDRVGIIAKGTLVAEGSVNDLIGQSRQASLEDAFVHYAYQTNEGSKR